MAAPIEEQMHQFLIEQEEERCRALEADYDKHKETQGKRVTRKQIPKPWARPSRNALCQNADLLLTVDEYDYDLSDPGFQKYCSDRGVLHVAGEPGSKRWKFFVSHAKPKRQYLEDQYFQFSEEVDGKKHRYTRKEMEVGWKIIRLGRAKLQDCWELYSGESHDSG